jgi:hypothetical protein
MKRSLEHPGLPTNWGTGSNAFTQTAASGNPNNPDNYCPPQSDPKEALPEDWSDMDEAAVRDYLKTNINNHLERLKAPDHLVLKIKRSIEEEKSKLKR